MECNNKNKIKLIDSNQLQVREFMYMLRGSGSIYSQGTTFCTHSLLFYPACLVRVQKWPCFLHLL